MIRVGLFAFASALCALGAFLTFFAGIVLFCLRSPTADNCFLCTFVLGPSSRLFEWLKMRSLYSIEKRPSLADCFDNESAMTAARHQFEAMLEKRNGDLPPPSPPAGRIVSLELSPSVAGESNGSNHH